jgi:hypothetical protein
MNFSERFFVNLEWNKRLSYINISGTAPFSIPNFAHYNEKPEGKTRCLLENYNIK